MNIKKIIIIGFIIVTSYQSNQAVIIGSNTSVALEATSLFPRTDTNNEMLGFSSFTNGFALGNGGTSCIFDAYFPIGTYWDQRDGTLNLSLDLTANESSIFFSAGTINGNGNFFKLPSDNTTIPFITSPTLTYITSYNTTDLVNSIDWSYDSQYICYASTSGNALGVLKFVSSPPSLTSAAILTISLGNSPQTCRFHTSSYNIAVAQSAGILLGDAVAIYTFNPGLGTIVSLVGAEPGLLTNTPVASAVSWQPSGNFLAASLTAGPNLGVRVYSFGILGTLTFVSGDATNTTVSVNGLDWRPDGLYLAAGSSLASNQLRVYTFNGTTLTTEVSVNIGQTVTAVGWGSTASSLLAVGTSGGTQRLRIYQFTPPSTLTLLTASEIGENTSVLSVDWSPDGTQLIVGLAVSGSVPDTEIRTYIVNQTTGALTLLAQVNNDSNVNSIRYAPTIPYIATGDAGDYVTVYSPTVAPFIFDNVKIVANSNVTFQNVSSLIFQGSCEIEANNYVLDITNITNFQIASGATLKIKDAIINGVNGTNINTADNTGILQLQNVEWIQNGNYAFSQGQFQVFGDLVLTGTSVFAYDSSQTSTITSNATMMFDSGMTFSYSPSSTAQNLLALQDYSSTLYFLNSTIMSGTVGPQFTNGALIIDGTCPIVNLATNTSQALAFGNGASAANNLNVQILPGSGLKISSGILMYNNV